MLIWRAIPAFSRRALRWDAISAVLGGLYAGALFPFLGVLARSAPLYASAYLIAFLNASGSVGNLFNPLMAHYIRRRPKLPYAVWPMAIGRAIFILMPLALWAPVFVAVSFFANAAGALGAPAYAAVIRDAYPVQRRGQLMGLVRVGAVAGAMVGALAGGFALERFSYRWVFPVVALVGLAAVAAFARIGVSPEPRSPVPARANLWEGFKLLRADRVFALYSAGFFLYGFGNLIMGPVIPIFQVDVLKITPQWVGYLAVMSSAFSIMGYLLWGRLLDRLGPFRLMLLVVAIMAVVPITYYFARSIPVLLIAAAAAGLAMAGGDLGYVNAALRFGPRDAAVSYAGMFAFLQAMRGIPAPFLGAALGTNIGAGPVFLIALACWVVSASIMLAGRKVRLAAPEDD
jgi:DHA1 family bicyclomycin/chloramphenicol resistance-like MFS transporter